MNNQTYWKDLYMRDVEGLNNEGDPIGGDPPHGLRHVAEDYRTLRNQIKQIQSCIQTEQMIFQQTGKYQNIADIFHLISKL